MNLYRLHIPVIAQIKYYMYQKYIMNSGELAKGLLAFLSVFSP